MGWRDDPVVGSVPAWQSDPVVDAEESIGSKIAQQGKNLLGSLRGAASIGATLITPVAQYDKAGNKDPRSFLERRAATLKEVDAANQSLGADPKSLVYQGAKLGTEVAGTLGVGGALANTLRAVAPAATMSPAVLNAIDAIRTAGMSAGSATGPAALALRTLGGSITGGVSAAMVDPESAGTGAAVGAATPGAIKVAGWTGSKIGAGAKKLLENVLGMSTGVGAEPVRQAFKAGATGNKEFLQNMTGDVPLTDVLDKAKQGVAAMAAEKSAQYRSGMIPVKNDKTVLSLTGIDKALQDATGMATFNGQVKNEAAAAAIQKMREAVEQWKQLDPAQFHTAEGIDALKQKLGGILESIPFNEKTARTAAGKVYNAAKSEITSQAPTYAAVMKDYQEAAQQISEIERALSLGDKASKDTAMRKLQSLMRNNVQTNYGNRLNLANTLEQQGGVELLPSLAGQAMNSWTPRSLSGQLGSGATALGAAFSHNPAMLGLLPFQSPRFVGSAAYGIGSVKRGASNALSRAGNMIGQNNAIASLVNQDEFLQALYRAAPVLAADR